MLTQFRVADLFNRLLPNRGHRYPFQASLGVRRLQSESAQIVRELLVWLSSSCRKTVAFSFVLCLHAMLDLCIVIAVAMTDEFQKALLQVRAQIAAKRTRRDLLDAEIAQLRATEIGLKNALGQQLRAEIAWTDLVRTVINQAAGQPTTAVQVRDTLKSWGYTFEGIANPLAFFNTILQRLTTQGELVRSDSGRPFKFHNAFYDDVPNPFGQNLGEMLNPGWKKKQ
ncbi:MAG: hypothetical protein WA847_03610 [Terriglobales bacterium]